MLEKYTSTHVALLVEIFPWSFRFVWEVYGVAKFKLVYSFFTEMEIDSDTFTLNQQFSSYIFCWKLWYEARKILSLGKKILRKSSFPNMNLKFQWHNYDAYDEIIARHTTSLADPLWKLAKTSQILSQGITVNHSEQHQLETHLFEGKFNLMKITIK